MAQLDAAVNPSPWPLTRFVLVCAVAAGERPLALVAHDDTAVLGFIVLSQVLDEGSIDNLAVLPSGQRRGTGRALVAAGIAQLRDAGVVRCVLEVRASNGPARKLYDSFGFTADGLRKNYYRTKSGREDAHLLSLRLDTCHGSSE